MIKDLLNGVQLHRPLFVPTVFSLGVKIENLVPRVFLSNPTKICSALRQTQAHLRADAVVCYSDPLLEAEALGGTLQWDAQGNSRSLHWPSERTAGELPGNLRSIEAAAKSGRVPIACEVLRRMASLPNRDFCVAVNLSGPFTLAARILQLEEKCEKAVTEYSDEALEVANSTITEIATCFLEAGAEIIFIQEDILPVLTPQNCAAWASSLAPTINVVRFYQALPALRISKEPLPAESCDLLLNQPWNCIVCLPLSAFSMPVSRPQLQRDGTLIGIALPAAIFSVEEAGGQAYRQLMSFLGRDPRPTLITTRSDVPPATDVKILRRILEEIRRSPSGSF